MYCHILRVCAIPTLESTDSMIITTPVVALLESKKLLRTPRGALFREALSH